RVEEDPKDRPDVEARLTEGCRQLVDRLLVPGRLDRPGRDLRLVGDEEVVEMPAHEARAGRLLHDDVDDVFAVEMATVTEKLLLPVVVIFGAVLELPREPSIR